MRLSMVRVFLKTAHHMGDVFQQPTEPLEACSPLTPGDPKFENPPCKRLEIPTLRSCISETEQNEPQKNYCSICVTHQTEHFWKHRKNFTRYVLGPEKSRPRISSKSRGIG